MNSHSKPGPGAAAGKPADDEIDDSAAPLIEHLAELRKRLIYSAIAFTVAACVAFVFWNPVFHFLARPICTALANRGQECGLVLIRLQEGFFVAISIALMGGFILAFPVIGYQLWRFVAPGLYKQEKNAFLPFMFASPIMFFVGAAFAYYVVLPWAFHFFLGFQQGPITEETIVQPGQALVDETGAALMRAGVLFQGSMQEYLGLTIKFIMSFGLCFQLPVLLTLMGKAGIVSAAGLAAVRKYAVVGILVLASVVTPPDVISQMVLFAAIYSLYEISIFLIRRIEKKREAQLRAEGLWFEDEEEEKAAQ